GRREDGIGGGRWLGRRRPCGRAARRGLAQWSRRKWRGRKRVDSIPIGSTGEGSVQPESMPRAPGATPATPAQPLPRSTQHRFFNIPPRGGGFKGVGGGVGGGGGVCCVSPPLLL